MDDTGSSNGEEQIDANNYKGIFYDADQDNKIKDEATGAHFDFRDMCSRLEQLRGKRNPTSQIHVYTIHHANNSNHTINSKPSRNNYNITINQNKNIRQNTLSKYTIDKKMPDKRNKTKTQDRDSIQNILSRLRLVSAERKRVRKGNQQNINESK